MSRSSLPTTGKVSDIPSNPSLAKVLQDERYSGGDHEDGGRYGKVNLGFLSLPNGEFPGTLFTVTGATWSAGFVTLTLSPAHGITAGQIVGLNSIAPSGYNNGGIPVAVTSVPDNTHIIYPLASNPGAYTSGGQVVVDATTAADGMVKRKGGVIYERESGTWNPVSGGAGTVTHTSGALTSGVLAVGNGSADIKALAALTWIAPTLLNSWANLGSPYPNVGFTIDPFGFVHFQGVITSGTVTINTVLFVLPSGYRPIATQIVGTPAQAGSSGACSFYVDTSGNVKIYGGWGGLTAVVINNGFPTF